MVDCKLFMMEDQTLKDALEDARERMCIDKFAPIERCRLVAYEFSKEKVVRSFEGQEDLPLGKSTMDILPLEFLVETRDENMSFEVILPGGVITKVFTIDIDTGDIDGPVLVRGMSYGTVADYKKVVAKTLNLNEHEIIAALQKFSGKVCLLDCDTNTLSTEDVSCFFFVLLHLAEVLKNIIS